MVDRKLYEITKLQLLKIKWEHSMEPLTIGQLLDCFYQEFKYEVPHCGYKDVIMLLDSMQDALKMEDSLRKPTLVQCNMSFEELWKRNMEANVEKGHNSVGPTKQPNVQKMMKTDSQPDAKLPSAVKDIPENATLKTLKAEIRSIFTVSKKDRMCSNELIREHKQSFTPKVYLDYSELFKQMPEVLKPIPGTDSFELVPSAKSNHVRELVNEQRSNQRGAKRFDDRMMGEKYGLGSRR